jgi:hypothetical protein
MTEILCLHTWYEHTDAEDVCGGCGLLRPHSDSGDLHGNPFADYDPAFRELLRDPEPVDDSRLIASRIRRVAGQ